MEIEKELGPVLDDFNRKQQEKEKEKGIKLEEIHVSKEDFKDLVKKIIEPVMEEFKEFLERKNVSCYIELSRELDLELSKDADAQFGNRHHMDYKNPTIMFKIYPKFTSQSEDHSEISFSVEDLQVTVFEKKLSQSGMGLTGVEGKYARDQITKEF